MCGDGGATCPVVRVTGCVVGVATWLSVPLANPTQQYIQLSATVLEETLNNKVPSSSSLLFKQGCVIEPGENVFWAIGVCGKTEGTLQCIVKLRLINVQTHETLMTHRLPIVAIISWPLVTINDGKGIDVGSFPEGYLHDTKFDVHNESESELAVLISLSQVYSSPVFRFKEQENVREISAVEICCILQPGVNSYPLSILAPNFNNGGGGENAVKISCQLIVKLDCPELPRPMLAYSSVSVNVIAIHLHVSRSCTPLTLRAASNAHASSPLTLKNLSCIPLSLSCRCNNGNNTAGNVSLAVVPDKFVVEPNTQASPGVVFTPLGVVTQYSTTITIVVEPYGLEYDVPVHVSSYLEDNQAHHIEKVFEKSTELRDNNVSSQSTNSIVNNEGPLLNRPMKPIEANKSRLVFGCVKVGTVTVTQKLSFFNPNTWDIPMSFNMSGSSSFSVLESGHKTGSVLVPAESVAVLQVAFTPTSSDGHSAVLVCKPRGQPTQQRIKYSVSGTELIL